MTREEAIKALKTIASYEDTLDYIKEHSVTVQDACNLAIKSLEAWDKVNDEIDKKRNSGQWSDAVIYGLDMAVQIIMKHLKEVEE